MLAASNSRSMRISRTVRLNLRPLDVWCVYSTQPSASLRYSFVRLSASALPRLAARRWSSTWQSVAVSTGENGEPQIDRVAYELGVLQTVRDKLRCKEIWVDGAKRYRNPDEDLPQDFEAKRATYYQN
jgi:hypothetical protein